MTEFPVIKYPDDYTELREHMVAEHQSNTLGRPWTEPPMLSCSVGALLVEDVMSMSPYELQYFHDWEHCVLGMSHKHLTADGEELVWHENPMWVA